MLHVQIERAGQKVNEFVVLINKLDTETGELAAAGVKEGDYIRVTPTSKPISMLNVYSNPYKPQPES